MYVHPRGIFVDIEGSGQDIVRNPNLQIGAAVMTYDVDSNSIIIHDMFDVCIEILTSEKKGDIRRKIIAKHAKKIAFHVGKVGINPTKSELCDHKIQKGGKHTRKEVNIRGSVLNQFKMLEMELRPVGDDQEFEPRCKNWWNGRKELLEAIQKNAIHPRDAYSMLEKFLLENMKKFDGIQLISDNGPYDHARISQGMRENGLEHGLEFLGGKYVGFGLDAEDYTKGVLSVLKLTEEKFFEMVNLEMEFVRVVENNKNAINEISKVPFTKHCALYDAIEIGVKHLLLTKFIMKLKKIPDSAFAV